MVQRFVLALALVSIFSGASCIAPPPQAKNPSIEESNPEKPKKQAELEKTLKEELYRQPEPAPEK